MLLPANLSPKERILWLGIKYDTIQVKKRCFNHYSLNNYYYYAKLRHFYRNFARNKKKLIISRLIVIRLYADYNQILQQTE